jgi:hypothetical protein
MDCEFRTVVPDPDNLYWFCDDDMAVLCTKTENTTKAVTYAGGLPFPNRPVTISCRPHMLRKESSRPNWCPLLKEQT